jgi:uncharacterized protein YjeT (DUF2065 family)
MKNFGLASLVAGLGIISIFTGYSYMADKYHLNTFFHIAGGVLVLVSVGIIVYKMITQDNTPDR